MLALRTLLAKGAGEILQVAVCTVGTLRSVSTPS